jgi:hypothetical protein
VIPLTATSPSSLLFPLKLAGLLTGLALAAGLVAVLRVPASDGTLGADVRVVATLGNGLSTTATGAFLSGRHLESGGEAAKGELPLRNDSAADSVVSFRALAPRDRLSRLVTVELSVNGHKLAAGSLARMRRWSGALRIPRGATRTVEASAWLPGSVRGGYEGRSADITLDIRAGKVRP